MGTESIALVQRNELKYFRPVWALSDMQRIKYKIKLLKKI